MTFDLARIETVRHASALGSWELVRCRPDARLAPYVSEYQGYRETTARPVRRTEVAIPAAVVILNFGPHWRLGDGHAPGRFESHGSFVAGMYSTYAVSENTGASHCLQFNLTPVGARLLFGMPLHHLSNRILGFADLFGRDGARLEARMAEAPEWTMRFALLDAFILERVAARSLSPTIIHAWRRLRETAGAMSVSALAAELDWSRKHLAVCVGEEIGLPPKTLARILRFHRTVDRIASKRSVRWSELALDCGYYDQAHLIRDFRQFAGMAPTEFLRRRLADGTGIVDDLGTS